MYKLWDTNADNQNSRIDFINLFKHLCVFLYDNVIMEAAKLVNKSQVLEILGYVGVVVAVRTSLDKINRENVRQK